MREIKFRLWNCVKENPSYSKMFYDIEEVMMCLMQQIKFNSNPIIGYNHEGDGSVFMQYVGLKDIMGRDIYEGDVLKSHGIVAWNDVQNRWSVIDLNWNDRREWHDLDYLTSPFEVVGNIYENPELIEN